MANEYLLKLKECYESLPIKLRLFIGMMIAAHTAALAIYFCVLLILDDVEYWTCLSVFLVYRVFAFMANKQMPLNDENVGFMSSERTLWNLATIAIILTSFGIMKLCQLLIGLFAV